MRRVACAGQRGIVRDQHKRCAFAAVELQQKIEHVLAVGAVEIAGGLVGEHDGRPQNKGAGQRHALLLAARKLDGIVIQAAAEADGVEQRARALRALPCGRLLVSFSS